MKIISNLYPDFPKTALIKGVLSTRSLLFDIETTGFSAKNTQVYLIGCAFLKEDGLHTCQFFAEKALEEAMLIRAFLKLTKDFRRLITFNGQNFDISYLKERCRQLRISQDLDSFVSIDIYKLLSPYRKVIGLPNLKQKTLEVFLGLDREDIYSGGDLIPVYLDYQTYPDPEDLQFLLLHNLEDLTGLSALIPMLSYVRFFQGEFEVISHETLPYQDFQGNQGLEWVLTLHLKFAFPQRFSYRKGGIYFLGLKDRAKLRLKIYQGELKYFYKDYKDYYYLPEEDRAIHKSVASFVDKSFREKAKAATCYSKKSGCFLPQEKELFSPSFKENHKDKTSYFELTEKFLADPELQRQYAEHLLDRLTSK